MKYFALLLLCFCRVSTEFQDVIEDDGVETITEGRFIPEKVEESPKSMEKTTSSLANNKKGGNIQKVGKSRATTASESAAAAKGTNNGAVSDIKWLKEIYNLDMWETKGVPGGATISDLCYGRMNSFLRALKNGTLWAEKMSDSSGRYGSQFFFGSDFWLGSRPQCRELQNDRFNDIVPPFPTHFYVVRFLLQLRNPHLPPNVNNRLVAIGLCLPADCSKEDVKMMAVAESQRLSSESPFRSLRLTTVKIVPGSYSLLADKKLHLLGGILSAVLLLIVIGTYYEWKLECRRMRSYLKYRRSISVNNNVGDDLKMGKEFSSAIAATPESNPNFVENAAVSSITSIGIEGDGIFSRVILSFSALSNSRKILSCGSSTEESLTCVHGLRFISLLWVILVHTYLQVFTIAENKTMRMLNERNFAFQTISNATFSVDTFFFISGLLVTYLYFKSARREAGDLSKRRTNFCVSFLKFFKLIGYRFLRLTPAYMFVLLIAEISMRFIHNTSVFEPISQNHISCDKYWWRNILYINSLFPMKDMCMLWSWYVSNDTQFYVLGVFILLFSIRYLRFAGGLLFFFLFTSWIVTILIALHFDYRAKIEEPFALFDELYDKPWTRLGPYLIGMVAGWYIFKTKCSIKIPKFALLPGWFFSLFTLFSLVYGLQLCPLGAMGSALYVSVGHTAWGIALAWIVIACCSGHGGIIDSILSYKLFQPLSRLTYCAYLVHPIIMTTLNFQMNGPLHLFDGIVLIMYMGNTVASFILSFCISLMFEAPTVRLLKIIFSSAPAVSKKNLPAPL